MERELYLRREGRAERWLRLLRDGGIALVGVAALAGLARDLSATRGPVVAWIIVTLLGAAAGLFAWSLLEVRDTRRCSPTHRTSRDAADALPAGDFDPQTVVPLTPPGLFPARRYRSTTSHRSRSRLDPRARLAPRNVRMRTRRTPATCAATPTRRPVARAARRLPPTTR